MKKQLVTNALVGFMIAAFSHSVIGGTEVSAYSAGVSGTIVDDSSGAPISGASIGVFENPYSSNIAGTISDAYGNYDVWFNLSGPVDTVFVGCIMTGYQGEWWDNIINPPQATPIIVYDSVWATNISFSLTRTGVASGITGQVLQQVKNDTIIGIEGAKVSAYVSPSDIVALTSVFTGTDGFYVLVVPPGQYYVKSEKIDYESEWYYEGTPQKITVNSGQQVTGINFTLTPLSQMGSISGIVVDEKSDTIDESYVFLYKDSVQGVSIDTQRVGNNGVYRFDVLKAGKYFVAADAEGFGKEWWNNKILPQDADSIRVTNGEITNVNFYLASEDSVNRGNIAGCVRNMVTNNPIEGTHVNVMGALYGSYTDCNGNYLIRGVPVGYYRAEAKAERFFAKTSDTFEVILNAVTQDIDFLLVPDTGYVHGSISGSVCEETMTPIFSACISVMPYNANYVVATARTDSSGLYTATPVAPGSYHVKAEAYGFVKEWYEEVPNRDSASVIQITTGQDTNNVDFTLAVTSKETVAGKIIDTTGAGIPFAKVWAEGINNWTKEDTRADINGCYSMNIEPGLYNIEALAEGYLMGKYPAPVEIKTDSVTLGIDVTLTPLPSNTGTISGVVTDDSTQNPLVNGFVLVWAFHEANIQFFGLAFTDTTGAYNVEKVPVVSDSVFYVLAFAEGYIPELYDDVQSFEDATMVNSNASSVDFELHKYYKGEKGERGIKGQLTKGKTAVPNAMIYAMEGEEIVKSTRSLNDGNYLLNDLPVGIYSIKITADGFKEITYGPVSVMEENVSGLDFDLQETGIAEKITKPADKLNLSVKSNLISGRTDIAYTIPTASFVNLAVYDASGRNLVTLVKGESKPGTRLAVLNTNALTQGIYFVRLEAGDKSATGKLIILH